jgi:succinate dehydrogenase / fumarate reductase, iron-sulfur subunit
MHVHLRIKRSCPTSADPSEYDTFRLTLPDDARWTILDVLDHLRMEVDPSLVYYRHSICGRGICSRCMAKINGRVERLCEYVVTGQDEIVLEPVGNQSVVRDLVTRKGGGRSPVRHP